MSVYVYSMLVEAEPMTFGDFLAHQDVECGENDPFKPEDSGYMVRVEEEDGEVVLVWEPDDIFETSHLEIGDVKGLQPHQTRLMVERTQLAHRLRKLQDTFTKAIFLVLPVPERELLQSQARAMKAYLQILDKRINLFLN